MAQYRVLDTELEAVANTIRTKGNISEQLEFPNEFVSAISNIRTTIPITQADNGKVVVGEQLSAQTRRTVTENDTYDTTTNNEIVVRVQPNLQNKMATQNGLVTADSGYDGLGQVLVDVEGGGTSAVLSEKTVTANGTYNPVNDGLDGYNRVTVDVSPNLQTKTVTTNGTVMADSGYDGLDHVNVNVSTSPASLGTKSITANGNYAAQSDNLDGYSNVAVNVSPNLQSKTATSNGTVRADSGYDGLSQVTVNVGGTFGTKSVTENGTYYAQTDDLDGYSSVSVEVQPTLQSKTATQNGLVTADVGYDGLSQVTVNVSSESSNLGTKAITANGSYLAQSDSLDGYSSVTVNVSPTLQNKTVTENGTVTPDSGYDGLSQVTVAVSGSQAVLGTKSITENGTYSAQSDSLDGYSTVTVNVSGGGGGGTLIEKSITANGEYLASQDGADGFSKVTVAVSGTRCPRAIGTGTFEMDTLLNRYVYTTEATISISL